MQTISQTNPADGFKQAFHQRCLQTLIRVLIFQPVFILGATLLLNLVFPDPLKWLDSLCIIGSLTNWLYIVLLLVSIVAVTAFHIQKYSVHHQVIITKWEAIWRLICPTHIIGIVFLLVISAVSVRCYLGLVGDQRSNLLSVVKNNYCFNEAHTFIVLHGAYAGMVYGFGYYLLSKNEVSFPEIQAKYLQLSLPKMFISSCKNVLNNLKWFYVLYYFLGHHCRSFLTSLLKIEQSCSSRSLDSISGMFDFSLFWTTWLSAAVVYFTWDVCIHIFQYYITKPYLFPIVPSATYAENTIYLHQAIVAKMPLLLHLGYMDLSVLSLNSLERRKDIFSLSHPGGHPYNWQLLSSECISILDTFTNDLNLCGNADFIPEQSKLEPKSSTSTQPTCMHSITYGESENVYTSKTPFRVTPASIVKLWCERKTSKFVNNMQTWFANLHLLRKRKVSPQTLLANCQIHIWAVQALSFLAIHSYREDKYGIVQQDLADIIIVLCKLQHALEKKQKWITRVSKVIPSYWDVKSFRKLLTETKLAVNRIANLFHLHLDGIDLTTDYKRLLQQRAKCE